MKKLSALAIVIASFCLTGCVSMVARGVLEGMRPTYTHLRSQMPPIPPNKGRVLIYSDTSASKTTFSNAVSWRVSFGAGYIMDGREYAVMDGFFIFADLPPGQHNLLPRKRGGLETVPAEGAAPLPFLVKAGETTYIEVGRNLASTYGAAVVDAGIAQNKLPNLNHTFKSPQPYDEQQEIIEGRKNVERILAKRRG